MNVSAAVGAIVIVATGVSVATVHGANGIHHQAGSRKVAFTVVERATSDTVLDNGASGDSIGDVIAFGNDVYNAGDNVRVGRNQGSCVRTNPGESYECEWTLILKDGQIVVQGPFNDTRDSTMAITGGTGRYRHATGQMVLHARNATEYEFAYTVYR